MSYRRPTQVLVHAVRRTPSGWRYLMLRRVPQRGGFWQGVSGGADWGEELPDAARRELWEETGLRPVVLRPVDYHYTFAMQERWRKWYRPGTPEIEEYVFLAVVEGEKVILSPQEHDDCRWCSYEEALGLLSWAHNAEALQRCQQALGEL
jgi:8-oxo-dGTP pyrophosphatase MutT (NUDIX family)